VEVARLGSVVWMEGAWSHIRGGETFPLDGAMGNVPPGFYPLGNVRTMIVTGGDINVIDIHTDGQIVLLGAGNGGKPIPPGVTVAFNICWIGAH
jgi:hypothetical protein